MLMTLHTNASSLVCFLHFHLAAIFGHCVLLSFMESFNISMTWCLKECSHFISAGGLIQNNREHIHVCH